MGRNTKKVIVPPPPALAASSATLAAATAPVLVVGAAGYQPTAMVTSSAAATGPFPVAGAAGCQSTALDASSALPAAATGSVPVAGAAGCQPSGLGRNSSKNNANSGANKTWTSLFKDNRSSTSWATLTKVTEGVEKNTIYFDVDEFDMADSYVSRSLIGFFSPKLPGIDAIKSMIDDWKYKCKVSRHTSSWIVFSFASKVEALGVLEAGPYQSFGNLLHLRTMPNFFSFEREAQRSIPVWVQLHNLPLEFWRPRLLSKLCTGIGFPLHTDQLTENMDKISFARCLVQVDVQDDLPDQLTINLSDGTTLSQPVLYENKPLCCGKCMRIGHATDACRDTGVPTLYVMRKPLKKVGNDKKVGATSASTLGWVENGRKKRSATVIVPQAAPEDLVFVLVATVSAPPDPTLVVEGDDLDADAEDGFLDDDSAFEDDPPDDPGDRVGLDEARLVVGPKASASSYATSSPTLAPTTPLILSGQSDLPSVVPPGYDLHTHAGKWVLTPSWPTVQDAASSTRTTRSRERK